MKVGLAFSACMLLVAAACSSNPGLTEADYQRELPAVVEKLKLRGDADSLAAAALFGGERLTMENVALIQRAVENAPNQADLAWLHLSICGNVEGCDPAPLQEKMKRVAPKNGVSGLHSIYRAEKSGDAAKMLLALQGMASASEFYTYYLPLQKRLIPAVERSGRMNSSDAALNVIGVLAAVTIPSHGPLIRACKDEKLQVVEVLAACRKIALTLATADTHLTQLVGLKMTTRAWPPDAPEYQAAVESRRVTRYRISVIDEIEDLEVNPKAFDRYVETLNGFDTEQDYFKARIVRAGRNPTPPAGWKDPESEERKSVPGEPSRQTSQ